MYNMSVHLCNNLSCSSGTSSGSINWNICISIQEVYHRQRNATHHILRQQSNIITCLAYHHGGNRFIVIFIFHIIWKLLPKCALLHEWFWERLIRITKITLRKILGVIEWANHLYHTGWNRSHNKWPSTCMPCMFLSIYHQKHRACKPDSQNIYLHY